MQATTYTAVRQNLARTMDRVCEDHEVVVITRQRAQSVVMISLEDYQALAETAYLLKTPANAERLLAALRELDAGQGRPLEIVDGHLVEQSGGRGLPPLGGQ